MNPEVKKQWVEALRSGKYKQAKSALHSDKGYCCLGVLLDCYLTVKPSFKWEPYVFDGDNKRFAIPGLTREFADESLPNNNEDFRDWVGGITDRAESELIALNDSEEQDFNQIADWIEKYL